jgi:hypothetical protein
MGMILRTAIMGAVFAASTWVWYVYVLPFWTP